MDNYEYSAAFNTQETNSPSGFTPVYSDNEYIQFLILGPSCSIFTLRRCRGLRGVSSQLLPWQNNPFLRMEPTDSISVMGPIMDNRSEHAMRDYVWRILTDD